MAYITFQPQDNFNTKTLYRTQVRSNKAITGLGFQPDMVTGLKTECSRKASHAICMIK